MSDGEKVLWLINRERIDRGIGPLHGLEDNVTSVAQYYMAALVSGIVSDQSPRRLQTGRPMSYLGLDGI